MKSCTIFFAVLFLSIPGKIFSQDPFFLNTNQSLIYLNPSFAGSNGLIRNQLSYRNQWPQLSGNYITYSNNFDCYIRPLKGAVAFSILLDDVFKGTLKTNVYSLTYAQHVTLMDDQLKIIPSLQVGWGFKSLDPSNLHFGDMIDPRRGSVWNSRTALPSPNKDFLDLSAGLLFNYKKDFYFGASVFHINQPDQGLLEVSKLPYRLLFHTSYTLHFSDKSLLQFFYRNDLQQHFFTNQLSANAVFWNHLITGLGYTFDTSLSMNIGYRNNYFSIVYGYDFAVGKLAGNKIGSSEIHASFNLRNSEARKTLTDFETW